jgi:hypothetical protein
MKKQLGKLGGQIKEIKYKKNLLMQGRLSIISGVTLFTAVLELFNRHFP